MRPTAPTTKPRASAVASRRGVALVMFVMLVFAFMGMAALCIDMGMASLTQAQMQNAVDSAAVEGVAARDFHNERKSSNIFRRRFLVPMRVRDIFDDDFVPHVSAPEQDASHYSAGPIFRLTGGIGDANASALIEQPTPAEYTPAESYVDSPQLRFNAANASHGDMLSGTYVPPPPGATPDWHAETSGSYLRDDFASASAGSPSPIVAAWDSWRSLGMLVRMRRVTPAGALDDVPNVSSVGPAVPFLFGLGSTMHAADGGSSNPRRDGLTVRATAIASGVPVLSAGPLQFTDDCSAVLGRKWTHVDQQPRAIYGTAPIVIDKLFWLHELRDFVDGQFIDLNNDGQDDSEKELAIDDYGRLTATDTGHFAGRVYLGDTSASECECGTFMSVGMQLPPLIPMTTTEKARLTRWLTDWVLDPAINDADFPAFANNGRCYIPIVTSIAGPGGPVERIVGFVHGTFHANGALIRLSKGWKHADDAAVEPGNPDPDFGQPCSVLVAPENASARATGELLSSIELTEQERTLVFRHLLSLTYRTFPEPPVEPPSDWTPTYDWRDFQSGALLAPGLVR